MNDPKQIFVFLDVYNLTNNVTTWIMVIHLYHINAASTRFTIEVTLQCRTSSDWRKLPWKFISWPFCEVVVVVIDVSTVQDILKKVRMKKEIKVLAQENKLVRLFGEMTNSQHCKFISPSWIKDTYSLNSTTFFSWTIRLIFGVKIMGQLYQKGQCCQIFKYSINK